MFPSCFDAVGVQGHLRGREYSLACGICAKLRPTFAMTSAWSRSRSYSTRALSPHSMCASTKSATMERAWLGAC